jgi:hypothetical protein
MRRADRLCSHKPADLPVQAPIKFELAELHGARAQRARNAAEIDVMSSRRPGCEDMECRFDPNERRYLIRTITPVGSVCAPAYLMIRFHLASRKNIFSQTLSRCRSPLKRQTRFLKSADFGSTGHVGREFLQDRKPHAFKSDRISARCSRMIAGGVATSVAGFVGQLILRGARERGQLRLLKRT